MNDSLFLVDAGNTRLKWAVSRDGEIGTCGALGYDELGRLADAARSMALEHCWIASVAGEGRNRLIAEVLAQAGKVPRWLESRRSQCGVVSHYSPPQQLGVDRWMALLAARRRCGREACLVVSAGTALTVDALNAEGHFLGGLIVAGRALMERALGQGTALVGQTLGQPSVFPCNTADAVRSGSLAAMAGAVGLMHGRLASLSATPPRCLLTGGDSEALTPLLPFAVTRVPELVLEGVCLAATDEEGR